MRKLILLVSLTVVLGSVVGLGVFIPKNKPEIPQIEFVVEESEEIATDEVEVVDEETSKQEVATSETKKQEENKSVTTTTSETSGTKQENNTSNVPKTEPKKEETVPPKVEEPKSEPKVEQDPEYLRLLNQVQYKTYEECMKAGFDIAEKDTVNIAGFSCPYIVYKGQILGYRLEITYY